MDNTTTTPEYLFESSWEVCNKVGGIYTVLSTKAHTLQRSFKDKLIFIGPDVWTDTNAPDFIEDDVLFADWKTYTKTTENLKVKVGRWNVPGTPPVILVDFKPFFKEKDSFSSRCGKVSEWIRSMRTVTTTSLVSSLTR